MKKIEAVFVPQKFDQVRAVMVSLNLNQFLLTALSAHEAEPATTLRWSSDWQEDLAPRLKLEVLVDDDTAQDVARAILGAARTRHAREAFVTMSSVESVVETNEMAPKPKRAASQAVSLHA